MRLWSRQALFFFQPLGVTWTQRPRPAHRGARPPLLHPPTPAGSSPSERGQPPRPQLEPQPSGSRPRLLCGALGGTPAASAIHGRRRCAQGTWNTSIPAVLSAIWPDRDTGYLKLEDQGARKTLHFAAPTQLNCGRERDRRDSFPKPHDRVT